MNTPNPYAGLRWVKSSRSSDEGACVEIARAARNRIALRDSKQPDDGPVLLVDGAAFTAFVIGARSDN